MEYAWIATALNGLLWIGLTFFMGLISRQLGLPPMVGFLGAGFMLGPLKIVVETVLGTMADLGIALLLFTIGLKIKIRNLMRPQVWAVTTLHSATVVALIASLTYLLALVGVLQLSDLSMEKTLLIAFALSFSSTVFVVKAMEEKGEMDALHGRIAMGILIIQDLFAVLFLAISANKLPSIWALSLLLLIPFRFVLHKLISLVGHGELLVIFGFLLAIGGAEIFELVGVKGDLGALVLGMLIATHPKSEELVKNMLSFKDLFLLGFFLSIGLNGQPTAGTLLVALLITPFILFKAVLFFSLFIKFNLRARTALLSTIDLSNYSEFGLIVIAIGVQNGWLDSQWLIIMALAISFSFVISSILTKHAHQLYGRYRRLWKKFQSNQRLDYDSVLDLGQAEIAVIGMGTVGTGAYNQLYNQYNNRLVGVDIDAATVANQCADNRNVILGDPSDPDFWERINKSHHLNMVLLTLPQFNTTMAVVKLLKEFGFSGQIAATAKFPDEIQMLTEAGVNTVFNMYTEAGAGFATHVVLQNRA